MPVARPPSTAQLAAFTGQLGAAKVAAAAPSSRPVTAWGSVGASPAFADVLAAQQAPGILGARASLGTTGSLGSLGGLASLGSVSSLSAPGSPGAASGSGAQAIAWARSRLGRQDWNGLCERFVEEAYGTSGVFPSAAAAQSMITHRGKDAWRSAPAGALVYFAPDATNGFNGHVGIALGGGRMISATPSGVREERLDTPYWAERFAGWGDAARFPGRAASRTPGQTRLARPTAAAGPASSAWSKLASLAGSTPVAAASPGLAGIAPTPAAPATVPGTATGTVPARVPVAAPIPWRTPATLHVPRRP
jgi:cell wall-associated NlpC family hydrolase